MSWLDRVTKGVAKGVGEGVNRAASEADKALKLTRVSNELAGKKGELDRAYAALGYAVWEMHHEGIALPDGLTARLTELDTLQGEVVDLEQQREAIKAGAPGTAEASQGAEPSASTEETSHSATPAFCAGCGNPLPAGAAHCPNCGRTVSG
jgi:hypothetical protein